MACHKQSNYNNCGAIEYKACNRVGIEPYLLCIFRFQGIHNIKDHTQKNDSHTKADSDNKYGVQFSNKRHIHHGIHWAQPDRFYNILKSKEAAEHEAKECGKDSGTADDSGKVNMLELVKKESANK